MIARDSVSFFFKNFFRTGMLKNKSETQMSVPVAQVYGSCASGIVGALVILVPCRASLVLVVRTMVLTAAMLANASPRNPKVCKVARSSK